MTTMLDTMKRWQDGYFTFVKRVEEPVLRFAGGFAESAVRYVPQRPRFMASAPTVHEMVDNQLEFRKKVVAEQAAFARKMMKAMDPVIVKFETEKPHERVIMKPAVPETRVAPRRAVRKVA